MFTPHRATESIVLIDTSGSMRQFKPLIDHIVAAINGQNKIVCFNDTISYEYPDNESEFDYSTEFTETIAVISKATDAQLIIISDWVVNDYDRAKDTLNNIQNDTIAIVTTGDKKIYDHQKELSNHADARIFI